MAGCTASRRARRGADSGHSPWVFYKAPAATVPAALTEPEQIQQGWTNEARIGGALERRLERLGLESRFAMIHGPGTQPLVRHTACAPTCKTPMPGQAPPLPLSSRLTPQAGGTHLDFAQNGYQASSCYVCVQGWAFFVGTSLKQYVETGIGIPYPDIPGHA